MPLPAPNLDDRRFQELVDEAKRMVQSRCPEWTDHNVSDPGVTLIETFAYMVDQLIYRVNRVPDRMYVKFLDLLGVTMFPPTAARAEVTFWLSAAPPSELRIPRGTVVATLRTEAEEAIQFSVTDDLVIPPVRLTRLVSSVQPQMFRDHSNAYAVRAGFDAFDAEPKEGNALYLGLDQPAPACALLLRFDCELRGVGVDPTNPPLVWEAWSGADWLPCEVLRDETGGLNRTGEVLLHLPGRHKLSTVGSHNAAWLRCSVRRRSDSQAPYSRSPRIREVSAVSVGGTTRTVNAEEVVDEVLGVSQGVPGQRFTLRRTPVVPSDGPLELQVSQGEGWETWTQVTSFAGSGPADRHFRLEHATGEVHLGPAVRERDGTLRHYGAVPATGTTLRVRSYRSGGGRLGNVKRGAICVLKSSIPGVARVENRGLGTGGADAETIEQVKERGPMLLQSRNRAVTPEDYEYLVKEVAPEMARVHCLPADDGAARIVVIPAVSTVDPSQLSREQLAPRPESLRSIREYLDRRRIIGVRVVVEPPVYRGITVVARLRASRTANRERVREEATLALYRYLHPTMGGPDGDGWILGRAVTAPEVLAVLDAVADTDAIDQVLIFSADERTRLHGDRAMDRWALAGDELPLSFDHQVFVEED